MKFFTAGFIGIFLMMAFQHGDGIAMASNEFDQKWKEWENLKSNQKFQEAAVYAEGILKLAREKNDDEQICRALIRITLLKQALHSPEDAVGFILQEKWPESASFKGLVAIFSAQCLRNYYQYNQWEINQRELISSDTAGTIREWTKDQIFSKILDYLQIAWDLRENLNKINVTSWSEYIIRQGYPADMRSSVRDFLTYYLESVLSDTTAWTAEQEATVFKLDFKKLLDVTIPEAGPSQIDRHPMERAVLVLQDAYLWHSSLKDRQNMLENRLEHLRLLKQQFTKSHQKKSIKTMIENLIESYSDVSWSAAATYEYALMLRADGDSLQAHQILTKAAQKYPGSTGGKLCLDLIADLEAPRFYFECSSSAKIGDESVLVTSSNLKTLYFRAYFYDVNTFLKTPNWWSFNPQSEEMKKLLGQSKPVAEWTVDLKQYNDFKEHKLKVAIPVSKEGIYLVAASQKPGFPLKDNSIYAAGQQITSLSYFRFERDSDYEFLVTDAQTGHPVANASIELWTEIHGKSARNIRTLATDAKGRALVGCDIFKQQCLTPVFRTKNSFVLADECISCYRYDRQEKLIRDFIYTDRSIYRPNQTVYFKTLSYQGSGVSAKIQPGKPMKIRLLDPNREEIGSLLLKSNDFGTASGQFIVPSGRLLGQYTLQTEDGLTGIKVEEYKRPTFEVMIEIPKDEMRLNHPASAKGKARYYFGMPVTSGTVKWRVMREEIPPVRWFFWNFDFMGSLDFWTPYRPAEPYEIASGTTQLDENGYFEMPFLPESDPEIKDQDQFSFRFVVSADVSDDGGETRSALQSVTLGKCAVTANIALESEYVPAGSGSRFSVNRTDLNGEPRPGIGSCRITALIQPETVLKPHELMRSRMNERRDKDNSDPFPVWMTDISNDERIALWKEGREAFKSDMTHDAAGKASIQVPPLGAGAYRIVYETKDSSGVPCEVSKEFLVLEKSCSIQLPVINYSEKTSYQPGETMTVFTGSGFKSTTVWFEVTQADKLLQRIQLDGSGSIDRIDIPVTEEFRGGISTRAYCIQDFRIYTQDSLILIPWSNKMLEMEFTTFRNLLVPGGEETWKIKVKGPDSHPVAAEVLAYMYDRSLDFFTPHHYPSVLSIFPSRWGSLPLWQPSLSRSAQQLISTIAPRKSIGTGYSPDLLFQMDGWGIGGPGRRNKMAMMERSGDSFAMAAPEALPVACDSAEQDMGAGLVQPPAPPPPAEEKPEPETPVQEPDTSASPRTNFNETAFFEPHLLTDPDGSAVIQFKVPDSVTSWNVYFHAITRDLKSLSVQKTVETRKDLMVRPYMPRFLRESDQAELRVMINNTSDSPLSGKATIHITEIGAETDATALFLQDSDSRNWTCEAGKSSTVTFRLKAPSQLGSYAFKIMAESDGISDGELRPLPVLPGRMHLMQSKFVTLKGSNSKTVVFDDMAESKSDPTCVHDSLVVGADGQLIYHVLRALPYLVQYPHECVEQTLNRFVSTSIVTSLYKRYPAIEKAAGEFSTRESQLEEWDADDPNRKMALMETPWLSSSKGGKTDDLINILDKRTAERNRKTSMNKLIKAQLKNGAFPWFPGGPESPFMTCYILLGLARTSEFDAEIPPAMTRRACKFLGDHFRKDFVKKGEIKDASAEFLTLLNYMLSCLKNPEIVSAGFSAQERTLILDYTFNNWKNISPYCKALLAITLQRAQRSADARLLIDSIMDSAKTTEEEGTFWAPEDRGWLWYNDTIESHAMILRALLEIDPNNAKLDGIAQWLFLNKKMNQWKSTKVTAEVIFSLVKYLELKDAVVEKQTVEITAGDVHETFAFDPQTYDSGNQKLVINGPDIQPDRMSEIVFSPSSKGMMFGSANWHYSTEKMPSQERGDFLNVTRSYFVRVNEKGQMVLKPVVKGTEIKVGDEIEVHLSISSKHPMEYVHLMDPRGAGFEPVSVRSGYHWNLGIGWYEEIRDSGANYFFEWLPQGEYPFSYRLRATMAGVFKVSPATLQSMYAPEFGAFSRGDVLEIKAVP